MGYAYSIIVNFTIFFMRYFFRLQVLLLILFVVSCASGDNRPRTNIRHSHDLKNTLAESTLLQIAPPEAKVISSDAMGKDTRMYDYEYFIQDALIPEIIQALREKGYDAKPLDKKIIKQEKLYHDIDRLKSLTKKELDKLYSADNPDISLEENAFNIHSYLGEPNKPASENSHLNKGLLLLSFYEENTKTSGAVAVDFLVIALVGQHAPQSNRIAEAAGLRLVLVDLDHNSVLWTYNSGDQTSNFGSIANSFSEDREIATEKLKTLVNNVLRELPNRREPTPSSK
jgi:hypothetical protein